MNYESPLKGSHHLMQADYNDSMATSQPELLYILSSSYSGSTLLTMLLATHQDIATIGELKATAMGDISTYNCSCGEKITACAFWNTVIGQFKKAGRKFDLANFGTNFDAKFPIARKLLRSDLRGPFFEVFRHFALNRMPAFSKLLNGVLDQNQFMIDCIKKLQRGKIFLDGSKTPVRLKLMLNSKRWRIKIIYLVRDGRGVAGSMMKHDRFSMQIAAKEWYNNQKECLGIVEAVDPADVIRIKYEDLCHDPERILAQLFSFCGLSKVEKVSDFSTISHHILGNTMRLKNTNEIRLDEKWKKILSHEDLLVFDRIGANMNVYLGY